MRSARTRPDGFTLIELLIVVAVIGILAGLLIPNLLDALHKSKQKRTVADMRITGTALMSWLTDQAAAAAAGAATTTVDLSLYPPITVDDLEDRLIPAYMQVIPRVDGWKEDYEYYLNVAAPSARRVMAIRSKGVDRQVSGNTYTVSAFDPTDYAQDIVWTDGYFVRWPQKVTAPATP